MRVLSQCRILPILFCVMLLGIQGAEAGHALGLNSQPKYPSTFTHFDYVNPNAPKGGELTTSGLGNFEKLNPYTLKGLAADGLSYLVFETLAISSADEPDVVYGLLAQDILIAADEQSITFKLNPNARFSNGDSVTAQDVKYSYEMLTGKQAAPLFRQLYIDIKQAIVIDRLTIRFDFKRKNRDLRMNICQLPVFSPKWGNGKPFDKISTDLPIASGPYVVQSFDIGKTIVYARNPNYWGLQQPTRVGMFNFDRIRYRYYKDVLARMEALKAGEIDYIQENSSKAWARAHQGRAWQKGELIKTEFPHQNGAGWQGFVMNLRRPIFQDIRVRQALGLAMDFEWMNRQLFFNLYRRSPSYFTNTTLAATGAPDPAEKKVIDQLRQKFGAKVPAQIEEMIPLPPSTTPPNSLRNNLHQAKQLLSDAGWNYRDGALRNALGQAFEIEMAHHESFQERVTAAYARNLEKLGIKLTYRTYDAALYQRKEENFDFDMIWQAMAGAQSVGGELALYFGSTSATQPGSQNLIGLNSPVVDYLIEAIIQAQSRDELVTLTRVLDRVLRLGYYIVPHFYSQTHRVSYRHTLQQPSTKPLYYRIEDWAVMMWWQSQARTSAQPVSAPPT